MQPAGFRPFVRGRWSPIFGAIAIVGLLGISVTAGLAAAAPRGAASSSSGASTPLAAAPPAAGVLGAHPSASAGSAVLNATGTFYGTNSSFASLPASEDACGTGVQDYWYGSFGENTTWNSCFGGAQNPSLLTLSNGDTGIAYETFISNTTNETQCGTWAGNISSTVAFQLSTDNGTTFGSMQFLGNQTCTYLDSIEPSFATSSNGDIYGTFVEENETTRNTSQGGISLPQGFGNRSADALGFTTSSNDGTSFSTVTTIAAAGGANIAVPQLAAFGNTVYITYDLLDNLTNLTLTSQAYSNYPPAYPSSVDLIYSNDGGATWNGPFTLPGLNGSQGYSAQTPAIAVSPTGVVAVAYATNHTCYFNFFGNCEIAGDDVVASTSSTNGSTWSAPAVLGAVGENHCAGYENDSVFPGWYECYAYQYQTSPEISVAWSDTAASSLYVAWSGEYIIGSPTTGFDYGEAGLYAAATSNGGLTWTNSTVLAPATLDLYLNAYFYDPALLVHDGTVYLAFTNFNETYCPTYPCNPLDEYPSYWLTSSPDGIAWAAPGYVAYDTTDGYDTDSDWSGYSEAITYSAAGPVMAFSEPQESFESFFEYTQSNANGTFTYNYWYNTTAPTDLTVATPYTGNTTWVNVSEDGLASGTSWTFTLGSLSITSNATTVNVTNVPVGLPEFFWSYSIPDGYWASEQADGAFGLPYFFSPGNETVYFSQDYGIELFFSPVNLPYEEFDGEINGQYYYFEDCGPGCSYSSEPFPWYFPVGTDIVLGPVDIYAPLGAVYFSGFGNGSLTAPGPWGNMTVNGPINETIWFGAIGQYAVTFVPVGLPSTSVYSFSFDGTTYTENATQDVTVPNVLTGVYTLGSISANASTAGWEYFGQVDGGNSVFVPQFTTVDLNFSTLVDEGAAAGTVSFQAAGLVDGDVWHLNFNGSSYASATPWINVTTHPGTFAVSAEPVASSANGTTAYAPVGFGPSLAVTTGSTYDVSYAPSYAVQVITGQGGSATGSGSHWLQPGALASYTATASADYVFLGWVGTGVGSYTGPNLTANVTVGGPITESANFEPLPVDRFNLTFLESGLPSGTWWTVDVGGVGYSTDLPTLTVQNLYACNAGAEGQYTVGIPDAFVNGSAGTRFVPGGYPSSTCTTGDSSVSVGFLTEYLVTPLSSGGGTAYLVHNGPTTAALWITSGDSVGLEETAQANTSFVGWVGTGSGSYTGVTGQDQIAPTGPITETATFQPIVPPPIPTYSITYHETTALANGTSWGIAVDGVGYAATGSTVTVAGLVAKAYTITIGTTYAPDHQTEYTPSVATTVLPITTLNLSENLTFSTWYHVSESATTGGSLAGAVNGFVLSGKTVALSALPNAGEVFLGWQGTGTGAYTGGAANETITVGSPVTEIASFGNAPSGASTSSSGIDWSSPTILGGLAVVGLIIGLAVGFVVFRGRGGPPGGGA